MDSTQLSAIVAIIQQAASDPPQDAEEGKRLYQAARQLMLATESPNDISQRVFYGVSW